ncbi:hypothetical protein BJY04DRAFT_178147 [Aspergillus karnatakaensis]|uniref:uncharacterized protein n=1 Tax=Aspergillus karnatakaensis TaxID=1810916 RepID=UPI003CCD4297
MSASELKSLLFFEDADTLAFIDTISYKPTWSLQPNSIQSIGHRIHSESLLRTGSPVLQQLFEPKIQERNIKRRGGLPQGIKYIIDLTPSTTEDDAVLLLTELSCPLGIRTWAQSQARWNLPLTCVGGTDAPEGHDLTNSHPGSLLSEYSPSRHRAGIVHILRVLEGLPVQLDTPCKLWTFFAVAKLYEIATLPRISQPITTWIYESNNTRLIEMHPEVTYQIGKGLQCPHLLRDSFTVLVGEEALRLLRDGGAPCPKQRQVTVHGRTQEALLDDDDLQRVQYAGESLLARALEEFVDIAGAQMHWLEYSSMFRNVFNYQPKSEHELKIVNILLAVLKDFARACIVVTLAQQNPTLPEVSPKAEPDDGYPTSEFFKVYGSLALVERILTRSFWKHLMTKPITQHDGSSGFGILTFQEATLANLGRNIGAFRGQQEVALRHVNAAELHSKANQFNVLLNPAIYPPGLSQKDHVPKSKSGAHIFGVTGYFSVSAFIEEMRYYLSVIARRMTQSSRPEIVYAITDTLTSLTDKEFRFLPLWADGCDDGTGGVFADQIPFADANGFSAPGPSIHTGSTAPSTASSVFSFAESTVHGASHRATEGFASEVVSINSDALSDIGDDSVAEASKYQKVGDELSFTLDSSVDGDDDNPFDSDSDDTVVIGHNDLSEPGDVDMKENNVQNLPYREKYQKNIHAWVDDTVQDLPIRDKNVAK